MDFTKLNINLVKHDTGSAEFCLPAYIEVHLGQTIKTKDKGNLVLDLGNYIYKTFGIVYEMTPEYRGKGKNTTLRWFISWKHLEPIRFNILKVYNKESMIKVERYLPFDFNSLSIQTAK